MKIVFLLLALGTVASAQIPITVQTSKTKSNAATSPSSKANPPQTAKTAPKPTAAPVPSAAPAAPPAPVPAAALPVQPVSLWGFQVGTPLPMLPDCIEPHWDKSLLHYDNTNTTEPCVRKHSSWGVDIKNVPYQYEWGTVYVTDGKITEWELPHIDEAYCVRVLQAMQAKLGNDGEYQSTPLQNGYGAVWNKEQWLWQLADGSIIRFVAHAERVNCFVEAKMQQPKHDDMVQP